MAFRNRTSLPNSIFLYSEEPYAGRVHHYVDLDGKLILSCPLEYNYMTSLKYVYHMRLLLASP